MASGLSGVGSAERPPGDTENIPKKEHSEFYQTSVEQYGRAEANVAVNIVHRKLQARERNNWDAQATYQEIAEEIINHPKTPKSTADIQRFRETIAIREQKTREPQQRISANETSTSNDGIRIYLVSTNSEKDSAYNCRVASNTSWSDEKISAVSNASAFGSGYAWGRLWREWSTGSFSGTFDITCDYNIQAFERNSSCKVSLFVREQGDGPRFKTVDTINSYVDDNRTRAARFDVDANETYDVGVELYTQSAAGGDPAAISDVYNDTLNNGRRHFEVNKLTLEEEPS